MAKTDTPLAESLAKLREDQIEVVKREQAKLDSLTRALIQATREAGDELPKSMEFADMGTTEATMILLDEAGTGLDTAEIAKRLKGRGIVTESSDFVASVYATLHHGTKGANPKFVRKNGLWYLAKKGKKG